MIAGVEATVRSTSRNDGEEPRNILLVDPSLFTAPYDAALSRGLEAVGLRPHWAVRRLRLGEDDDIGPGRVVQNFYPLTDGQNRRIGGLARALKGVEHALGLGRLVRAAASGAFDLVHFQWLVVPRLDVRAIRRIQRHRPVVLTIHDTTPFNGKPVHRLQRDGFAPALATADRLIVHTSQARSALAELGISSDIIHVVPHGLLPSATSKPRRVRSDDRWRIVQFGKIQDYKGVDVLIEALGLLPTEFRKRIVVTVAGEPLIDIAPLVERAEALGLSGKLLDLRFFRHSDADVAALLDEADAFVFPYRTIEASGVLFLVADAGKWLIASDLGAFAELIGNGDDAGELVAPGDPAALADALVRSIGRRPTRLIAESVPSWAEIGAMTSAVYRAAAESWRNLRGAI